VQKAGLIWIGAAFYKNTHDFQAEARALGISRRVYTIPRGFVLGETWVALAHIAAIQPSAVDLEAGTKATPGIFSLFKPTALEYVVKGTETDDELDALRKRGIEPVRVERAQEQEAA
jgi:hypothetical protein